MLLYYEQDGVGEDDTWDDQGWGRVYIDENEHPNKVLSCSERYYYAAAQFRLKMNQNTHEINTNSQKNMVASGHAYFKSQSPKYFFVAVSNCNPSCACDHTKPASMCSTNYSNTVNFCDGPLVLDYDFAFTNGDDLSKRHFGYDEIGCLAISWVFFIFYAILVFVASISVKNSLKSIDKYHVTVKLIIWSIWIMMASCLLRLYHYLLYSGDGVGERVAFFTASILASFSEILLVVHLILIAKGWTIVRRKISASGRVKVRMRSAYLHT